MGKNLYYTIPRFFEQRMSEHSAVKSFRVLPNEHEFIYEIKREIGDTIRVWLADQYNFDTGDFENRPREICAGDYILIARPEAHGGGYSEDKIRIGKLADFMGALTKKDMWRYEPPSDEDRKNRKPFRR